MDRYPCKYKEFCSNNEIKCWICKFDNESCNENYYRANEVKNAPKIHPFIKFEKDLKNKELKAELASKKAANKKDKSKQTLAAMTEKMAHKLADRAIENKLKKEFSSPTVNSGRRDRDVDHTMHKGLIRLDSKHQSKKINPTINLKELDDCIDKSRKFKSDLGGLILWNKNQRPIVVFNYDDWLKWESFRDSNIEEISE